MSYLFEATLLRKKIARNGRLLREQHESRDPTAKRGGSSRARGKRAGSGDFQLLEQSLFLLLYMLSRLNGRW